MKSVSYCCGLFLAWTWTVDPTRKFLFASYALTLSIRDPVKCRRLIDSPWYKQHFGNIYGLTARPKSKAEV